MKRRRKVNKKKVILFILIIIILVIGSIFIVSKLFDKEELFTEDNFKILDILLDCRRFSWPLRKY